MNARTTFGLLILNGLVLAALVLTRDRQRPAGRANLLPAAVDLARTTVIRFSAGPGCPAFTLQRGADGRWHLDRTDGPLARQASVQRILEDFQRAPILPFEAGAGQDLGLNPPARTVTFSGPGTERVVLELGKPHPLGLGVFARIRGEAAVHLTVPDLGELLDRRPGHFREPRVFPFTPLGLHRLALRRDTPSGPETIEAERKWLTWFIQKPRRLRGETRAFDGLVSALLGIQRQGAVEAPDGPPDISATLHADAVRVTLDIWTRGDRDWIGRVRGEESGFPLRAPELSALRTPFRQLWDHRLFYDSSRQATRVEWALDDRAGIVLERDVANPDVWRIVAPRKARADRAATTQLLQDLVRLEADGLEPPGTRLADVGLAPPAGRLAIHFTGGAGRQRFEIGAPRGGTVHLVSQRDRATIFRLNAAKLRRLPRSLLELVDRTVYRGDWRTIRELVIQRGVHERFRLKNVGRSEARQWQRTDVSDRPRHPDAFVAGEPMRMLIAHLTGKLRAEAVLAWSPRGAPPAWGMESPLFVVTFRDATASPPRFIDLALGHAQQDRIGRTWYPAWLRGLPDRAYVYKIGDELARKIEAVLPEGD